MSERIEEETPNVKRRRLRGACDACRKKKVRCDSAAMPGNRCTHCITFKIECAHTRGKETSLTPENPTAQEHVVNILSTSTVYIPSNDPYTIHEILVEVAKYARSLEELVATLQAQIDSVSSAVPSLDSPSRASNQSLNNGDETQLSNSDIYGSRSMQFVKTALQHVEGGNSYVAGMRRPEFWIPQPWEIPAPEMTPRVFPDDDLLKTLITIYFDQINPLLGILHFPSFRDSLAQGQHLRNRNFAFVVLAVCALASRYSDDPRVFLERENSEHTCGWRWFRQIEPFKALSLSEPGLCRLQWIALSVMYLVSTTRHSGSWVLAAVGIRFAQSAGVHNQSIYKGKNPLEAEMYKRVFWMLVTTDMIISSFNGRPKITHRDDFDVDFPLECDDEFLDQPNPVQPPGIPSSSAFLVVYLRLMDIYGRIQHAIYPVKGEICGQEMVIELDSALNSWLDTVPDHLRWDPNRENQVFLDQSAALYATYYHTQILIHRPFIPAPGKATVSSTNFPSLAICANAARSCGHVLDVQSRRGRGLLHHPHVTTALFDSAVVLLFNVWGGREHRTPKDLDRATADIQNCVRILRLYERRWRVAGRKCDIISAMINLGKYTSNGPSLKRSREVEEDKESVQEGALSVFSSQASLPTMEQQTHEPQPPIHQIGNLFSLPLHTDELGRLPAYDSFDYIFDIQTQEAHYQPQSHLYSDSTYASTFAPAANEQTGMVFLDVGDLARFGIPSGDNWQDWSTYFASIEEYNRNFVENQGR
ncbi:fungal-specific transcription factor domain-containing protein [Mycena rebaudengoi]|nr:fungal-specific transcription factor domain-containing protein [Mycena rebaudengoi]